MARRSDEIAAFIDAHVPALRRYAFALTRDHAGADDLVQDCLERALASWRLRRADGDGKAWLLAILRNRFISLYRQRRTRGAALPLDAADHVPSAAAGPDATLALRDVLAALDTLPEEQKSALLLVGVEDLSYEEAAKVMGVPPGTIMSRLSRGRERLRTLLAAEQPPSLRRVK